jgi:SAM-dependent methyltransferase
VTTDEFVERVLVTASEREPGLWVANGRAPEISYPETGHRNLASIEDESYWFEHRAKALLALLENHPPPGCLFDVGGGNGYMVRALRQRGYNAILVEPGEDGCTTALQRGLTPVVNGTTRTVGVRPGSLPAVGLFDVIEHIEADSEFARHIHDLLQPGGRLYVTVPAHGALWSANDVTAGHFRRYSGGEITRLTAEAGFTVLYTTYLFRVLVVPVFAFRALPHRLGMKESRANTTDAHQLPGGVIGRAMSRSLERELRAIENGSSIGWGSSVLVVAEKPR